MNDQRLLLLAVNAAIEAGNAILDVYETDFDVEIKSDNSPLTKADRNANQLIVKALSTTALPILSEEGKHTEFQERKNWDRFWMVDPLDGTKEFVKRNGEFTVNIALMQRQYPVFGIIYVPVKKQLYFSGYENGAYKAEAVQLPFQNLEELIASSVKLPIKQSNSVYTMVGSKSHPSAETKEYMDTVEAEKGQIEVISMGSSLKLCLVAEGQADEYPRFAPTMEWDTAAGQAIVEASNAIVLNWKTKRRMAYNKENLLNSWFLATRDGKKENL